MAEFPTASFEGWRHTEIQGEQVDTTCLPFSDEFIDSVFPAAVAEIAADGLPENTIPLAKLSSAHGRSYEIRMGERPEVQLALWQDQYANRYTSLTTKGNNFTDQRIMASLTAPSGYIPYGLMEDDALLRVLRASRMLREANISTEWIVRIIEPKQLMFGTEIVSQADYRKRLVEADLIATVDFDENAKIATAVENMTFFTTVRAMEIGDRPSDFTKDNKEMMLARLAKVFMVYGQTHRSDPDFRELSVDSEADRQYYLTELLPKLVANNLVELRKLGLMHTFPVPGNVNVLGGLIDLDSVKGEPLGLGDKPLTEEDFAEDVKMFLSNNRGSSIAAVIARFETFELLGDAKDLARTFQENFLRSYMSGCGLLPVTAETAVDVLRITHQTPGKGIGSIICHDETEQAVEYLTAAMNSKNLLRIATEQLLENACNTVAQDTIRRSLFGTLDKRLNELPDGSVIDDDLFVDLAGKAMMQATVATVIATLETAQRMIASAMKTNEILHTMYTESGLDEQTFYRYVASSMALESYADSMLIFTPEMEDKLTKLRLDTSVEYGKALEQGTFTHKYTKAFEDLLAFEGNKQIVDSGKQIVGVAELDFAAFITRMRRSKKVEMNFIDMDMEPSDGSLFHVLGSKQHEGKLTTRAVFTNGKIKSFVPTSSLMGGPLIEFSEEEKSYVWLAWLTEPDENGKPHMVIYHPQGKEHVLTKLRESLLTNLVNTSMSGEFIKMMGK